MTNVTLKQELFSRYSVECEGHATGSAAVCAAVSCLVSSLESWAANSPNARVRRSEVRPGFACIELRLCGIEGRAALLKSGTPLSKLGFGVHKGLLALFQRLF